MIQKNIIVPKTARYFIQGEITSKTKTVWIVLHGYAQLANYFIKNFQSLSSENTVIIAPEGLHRFYWQGFSGKVVASWMTKEDRLEDIKDYANFLEILYNEIISELNGNNARINILAFSQGTATALRWLSIKKPKLDSLILWGGTFPADINFELDKNYFNRIKLFFVMGINDEYISPTEVSEQENILKNNGITFSSVRFEGKHEICQTTLLKINKEL